MAQLFPDFWATKMRKVFAHLDSEKKGSITLDGMNAEAVKHVHHFPGLKIEDLQKLHAHSWKVLFHSGRDVPSDQPLTEEDFIKNMWTTVNQPGFKDEVKDMMKGTFAKMDLDHDGHITKEEFLKTNAMRISKDHVLAVFEAMDKNDNGTVELDELIRAKLFYYTDTENPSHPFNLLNGPLE